MAELSPMMSQYLRIKEENPDSVLFFRVGDFYEMFFEDAEMVSEELDLVLTGKDCGMEKRAPMCGVPFHSAETYIARLVKNGHKVAICEQVEDPGLAKGLVRREIIRVVTPGTVIEDSMLEAGSNNFLCAIAEKDGKYGLCFCDASTGVTRVTQIAGEDREERTDDELNRYMPKETLIADGFLEDKKVLRGFLGEIGSLCTFRPKADFDPQETLSLIQNHFHCNDPEQLGVPQDSAAAGALGAIIRYLYETGISGNIAVKQVSYYSDQSFMRLDATAIRNLEIRETMRSKSKRGSLLWVIDKTETAMGKRLIRSWIEQPLTDPIAINARQNAVEELCASTVMRGELGELLCSIKDIERLMTRVVYATGSARDLKQIGETLAVFPQIKETLAHAQSRLLRESSEQIDLLEDIKQLIDSAIAENPPALVREGGMIRSGYHAEVDSLRDILENGTGVIGRIEAREREATGIRNLKVKYNKVFGYYIEVSNSFLSQVPDTYIRKQTLTGGERYITEELKELEAKILGAKDRIVALEYELFDEVRKKTAEQIVRFQKSAQALARIDVFCSLAKVAVDYRYCRPKISNNGVIRITGGRHPVVERLSDVPFVTNDTYLDNKNDRCAIITGPNMAGKSTYMRQVAIIVILAQIGSFVPASSAEISVCDAVFTRVGASDDLASGQSTFMVEMNEVATILKYATHQSLLILDEIGRGTSTYDGMSIARAVLEYVADKKKIGAKALFATHYHELTSMENEIPGIRNYNIAVKRRGEDLIFLRRIVPGCADDSYGIIVAKMAGIPSPVVKRAQAILHGIESEGVVTYKTVVEDHSQMSLEMQQASGILRELKTVDVNTLTPIEAMKILNDLSQAAKS